MPPGAGDNVTTMVPRPEGGLRGLRRLCGPSNQFRPASRQFGPAVVEFHIVTDLDPELAEVAVKDRQRVAGGGAAPPGSPLARDDEVNFLVWFPYFSPSPAQDRRL